MQVSGKGLFVLLKKWRLKKKSGDTHKEKCPFLYRYCHLHVASEPTTMRQRGQQDEEKDHTLMTEEQKNGKKLNPHSLNWTLT